MQKDSDLMNGFCNLDFFKTTALLKDARTAYLYSVKNYIRKLKRIILRKHRKFLNKTDSV